MRRLALAVAAAVAVAALGVVVHAAVAVPPSGDTGGGTRTVRLRIHHSHFEPSTIDVRRGTTVRFVVTNDDPIAHEFIVGGPDVHARHATGTERVHPPVPGEVSIAALGTGVTAYAFAEPGTVLFACHLPRHFEYGMQGEVRVR
jgi:uncharacterized cupredoxin-like copper-binding protein